MAYDAGGPGAVDLFGAVRVLPGALCMGFGSGLINRLLPDHVSGRGWDALPAALVLIGVLTAVVVLAGCWRCAPWPIAPCRAPEDVALLSGVGVLASLPGLCIERLAVVTGRWAVEAGEVVVHEGEPGQEFFVVADGELVVSVDGQEVRRLGRGDAFGEVALLRHVPRTETVVASRASVLLTVDREAFVSTATGHRPTDDWAEGAVAGLLAEDARRA